MTPILGIHWSDDFIGSLKDLVLEHTAGDLRDALIIFPHQRPKRHFMQRLTLDPKVSKPLFLPQMQSVNDWLPGLRRDLDPTLLKEASLLDRIGLLWDVVRQQADQGQLTRLPEQQDQFFPWGRRLANLFEELLRHGCEPQNLLHLQDEVQPTAAALLENLEHIFEGYCQALSARGWTTPGLDAKYVATHAHEVPQRLGAKSVFIAGFYALTETENDLFKALWEQGAHVVWHTDTTGQHWACKEHRRWLKRWGTTLESQTRSSEGTPKIHFYEGYDLHSQLGSMREELSADADQNTAVIIPDTATLMPVLHHLPIKDVNISMGYPLDRSGLFRLVKTLLRLQESAPEPGLYYWREVVALIRHPYIKMLEPRAGLPLRGLLRELEKDIRKGGKYLDPLAWAPPELPEQALPASMDKSQALETLGTVLGACLTTFESVHTLQELGQALLHLAQTLVPEDSAHNWHRFPIDAECLYRLATAVVPQISDSTISEQHFDQTILFSILRQMLQGERVPFEAEPLSGLQVMGMLESRLLHFSKVVVLDAVEDKLPGSTVYDPLLPDPLRVLLGLPDGRQRTQVAAHNFYRLISGAKEVSLYYQTGCDGAGALGGKNIRSRFVEQLLWEEERKTKQLTKDGDGTLTAITLPVRPIVRPDFAIKKTPLIQSKVEQTLQTKSVSATFLDSYLRCPARFFYERLTPLRQPDEVNEQGDHAKLGELVHEVLKEFLTPWLGRRTDLSSLPSHELEDLFSQQLQKQPFFQQMPWDLRFGLQSTGCKRLRDFLSNQSDTTILLLEEDIQTRIDLQGQSVNFFGRLDRVDRRPEGDVVLDYKTGAVFPPTASLWTNEELWDRIAQSTGEEDQLSLELAEKLKSTQLPLYAWMYWKERGVVPTNAAWVELRDKGLEKPLFKKSISEDARVQAITEYTPILVRFLLGQMLECDRFPARPGQHCQWCPFDFSCPLP